jgi:UDPglucose 6-dehydrogenase
VSLTALTTRSPELGREPDLLVACKDADLLILGTEWQEYKELDPNKIATLVATKTIIDGRNVLAVAAWQKAGFKVIALGRNIHNG